jgi:hypothetical protein
MFKWKKSAALPAACGILAIAIPTLAQAASLTFTFTCQVVTSLLPDQCVEGGSGPGANPNFGTLTFTDSVVDPNRVDISWNMTPQWGTNIEKVLLNYNTGGGSFPTNHSLFLVDQSAPAGSTTNLPGATALFGNNGQPQGSTYQFDIRLGEGSGGGLTFSGSLALRNNIGGAFVDLSTTSFLAASNNLNGAVPVLYALYTTAQPGTVPPGWTTSSGTEFWAGVSAVVPVPAAVWLLGSALGVLGAIRRRTNA